jgi:hypothetical protein
VIIKFEDKEFEFVPIEIDEYSINGHFQNDIQTQKCIESIEDSLEDDWYLDENGERLEDAPLFSASPWSVSAPFGEVKLLRRFYDLKSGEAFFSTQQGYGGELFKWLRSD